MAYYCDCGKISENQQEGGSCATCAGAMRKALRTAQKPRKIYRISKVSVKRRIEARDYPKKKAEFMIGKICPIYPHLKVEDIHHKKGRDGFADQWAKDHGIILLMDVRFWLAVSRKGHTRIGLYPAWARQMGYNLPRQEITQ